MKEYSAECLSNVERILQSMEGIQENMREKAVFAMGIYIDGFLAGHCEKELTSENANSVAKKIIAAG